jgi:hypothetical protein
VPLDLPNVMARRAEGVPEVHIPGAADRLLEHLVATEANALEGREHSHGAGSRRCAGDGEPGRGGTKAVRAAEARLFLSLGLGGRFSRFRLVLGQPVKELPALRRDVVVILC